MTMITWWAIWFWGCVLATFAALETYAGITKQDTLSQTAWKLQDQYPIATWLIVIGMVVLIIHLTGHRLLDLSAPTLWIINKLHGN
ncbi:MAG TPA: hypothetical protein VEP90_29635 [Methylomirabilota bacterium]|nr:hypothetical protein [Methylomirabilota bacterium]